jgi:hypothetical protein
VSFENIQTITLDTEVVLLLQAVTSEQISPGMMQAVFFVSLCGVRGEWGDGSFSK